MPELYPALDPYERGRVDVGDGHSLYWETCGDPAGQPALVLHGGPGSGCTAWHRCLFDPDAAVRDHAAYEWCLWESAIAAWPPATDLAPRFHDRRYALGIARIVTHYVLHDAWLEDESLLEGASVLADTPVVMIDGAHDPQGTATAEALARTLPRARHVVVADAGHAAAAEAIASELARATDRFGRT